MGFEFIESPEVPRDLIGQRIFRLAAPASTNRSHVVPKNDVIEIPARLNR